MDDVEHFGVSGDYFDASPARAVGDGDDCPAPLATACAAKGKIAAFLAGPIDCDKRGWFCRIERQDGFVPSDGFRDSNFAHCNRSDADESDADGHCHGSDSDETYGWWVRDHWFRGYAGRLTCCCDWNALKGLTNRCDYRRRVSAGRISGRAGTPTRTTVRRSRDRARRTPSSRSTIPRRAPTVSAGASTRSPTPGRRGSRPTRARATIRSDGFVIRVRDFVAPPLARRVGLRGHLRRLGDYRRVRVDAHRECSRVFKSVHVY